jgi:hypothetical protein
MADSKLCLRQGAINGMVLQTASTSGVHVWLSSVSRERGKVGWEAGIRTPIRRSRICSPTVGRPPSKETRIHYLTMRTCFYSLRPTMA